MQKKQENENVIIIGGDLSNKGAQAMTFTVIDQIKKSNPSLQVFMFSHLDYRRDDSEKNNYNFRIMPWSRRTQIRILVNKLFVKSDVSRDDERDLIDVIRNARCFIDVSGYALSSSFHKNKTKNLLHSARYFMPIMIAKKFSKRYYIFPQSLGPFKYPFLHKIVMAPLMHNYLKYPTRVYAREKNGYEQVLKYSKNNVELKRDLVLLGSAYDLKNIYRKAMPQTTYAVKEHSVGIIPNTKVLERMNSKKFITMYTSVIKELLRLHKQVYILRHSFEDLSICLELKEHFRSEKRVNVISDDLSCIELERIIGEFEFVVASRYHAVVHAYKNNIPVLCIGWAVKYTELVDLFSQSEFYFDITKGVDEKKILRALTKLSDRFAQESKIIASQKKQTLEGIDYSEILKESLDNGRKKNGH